MLEVGFGCSTINLKLQTLNLFSGAQIKAFYFFTCKRNFFLKYLRVKKFDSFSILFWPHSEAMHLFCVVIAPAKDEAGSPSDWFIRAGNFLQ